MAARVGIQDTFSHWHRERIDIALLLGQRVDRCYYADAERFGHNQLLGSQFLSVEQLAPALERLPADDTPAPWEGRYSTWENVAARQVGGFAARSTLNDAFHLDAARMMQCCNGAGTRALYDLWRYAAIGAVDAFGQGEADVPAWVLQYTQSGCEEAMTTRTITLTLPEDLYAQLEAQARRAARPVDDVAAQTIARGLIAARDPDLAPEVQAELAAMGQLADAVLWDIAGTTASSDTIALYDLLTQRQQDGALTPEGQQWLERVRAEADRLLLRKAHAYALLKQRGHRVPAIEDLPLPRA